jgi:hypothetical protein
MALAGKDPGVGGKVRHDALQRSLRTELRFLGMDYHVVQQTLKDIETRYLTRWASALRTNARPAHERTARAIAGHLLDSGYRWIRNSRPERSADDTPGFAIRSSRSTVES